MYSVPDKVVVAINNKTLNVGLKNDESTSKYEKTVSMRCLKERKRLVVRVPIEKSHSKTYISI